MLKFPVDGGIVTICSTILIPAECAMEVAIEGTLSAKGQTELCSLLKENLDIFAWHPSDMTGVPRSIVEHRLNIREGYSPVRQKKRGQAPECTKAIQTEKGYHQIQMAESDKEKTAFHTSHGVYCYTKRPFGLKNADATYQRLVDKAFDSQVGRNIEVYVDDLVIKSHTEAEMQRDIDETFRTLRKINMKLNPKKYTFGAVEGMFLGYMISSKGIKPCPDKTEVVLQLPFLSKSAEKSLPLFKTLKKCIKKSDFHWTPDAEQALKQLKQHLSELPLLVAPKSKEELIVYLFASHEAISAVLMTERSTVQTSVYFVSCALQGPELNYTPMEKLVLSLVFARDGSGAGLILTSPEGTEFTYALRFQFTASNNEAEYEALIAGLRIAAQMGVRNVHVSVDSNLVANQVLGAYVAKEENMIKYLEKVKSLLCALIQIGLGRNTKRKIHTREGGDDRGRGRWTNMDDTNNRIFERKDPSRRLKGGKQTPYQGQTVRIIERGSLQAVVSKTMATVCWTTPSGLSNRSLGDGIKARLGEGNKNWIEELPHVLWAHRMTIKSSHGDTPFSLTYGTEAVIHAEIGMPTYRTTAVDAIYNDEELRLNLDLLEERRERAAIHEAKAKLQMTKYYNARV
ncbi:reverse transcriptase domain-containing protein [Tanacetum coccineum]